MPELELIWASPREVLNVVQADECGCHIITVTHDLLKKLPALGKDLDDVLARDRADVPPRRRGGRLRAVTDDAVDRSPTTGTPTGATTRRRPTDNPAQRFRRDGRVRAARATSGAPQRLLDIGAGQGDLLAEARARVAGGASSPASSSAPPASPSAAQGPRRPSCSATCCTARPIDERARRLGDPRRVLGGARARRRPGAAAAQRPAAACGPGAASSSRSRAVRGRRSTSTSAIAGTTTGASLAAVLDRRPGSRDVHVEAAGLPGVQPLQAGRHRSVASG